MGQIFISDSVARKTKNILWDREKPTVMKFYAPSYTAFKYRKQKPFEK